MAITTLSGVKAGLQPPVHIFKGQASGEATGVLISMFYASGIPGAAVAPSPGINGAALTSYAGQLPFNNPVSGNAYLAGMIGNGIGDGITNGCYFLYDRLWHNSGILTFQTTEQSITSPTWPARDRGGATDGDGVMVGIEVSASMGNGAIANTTLNYTNSAGVSGRTGTITSVPATLTANSFIWFELQNGDVGVRSVQGLTLGTSYVSGTMHLVAARQLMQLIFATGPVIQDFFADVLGCGFTRLFDNTVPFLLSVGNQATTSTSFLTLQYAHG